MGRIAIVGGGMAGASLALLLARATTHDIVLVEQAALAGDSLPDTPSYDARSTALSLGSAEQLAAAGAWHLLAPHASPIRHIEVSHQGFPGAARLDAEEEEVAALGFVVENRHLGFALLSALRGTRVRLLAPATIAEAVRTRTEGKGSAWQLTLADGRREAADLLVVADGAGSRWRAQLGIVSHAHDYGAAAIVCNATPCERPRDRAFERFTVDGALAMLPLTGGRCAIVWSVPLERADALCALDDMAFAVELSAAAGQRLGGFSTVGERTRYPVVKVVAVEQAVPGAVLLGNAAHLLHPVAGQGFNLTLRDAAALAAVLSEATCEAGIADPALLARYEARRLRDQGITGALSHGLPLLFGNADPVLSLARDAGLMAFGLFRPLKREFARQAMGIGVFTGGLRRAV